MLKALDYMQIGASSGVEVFQEGATNRRRPRLRLRVQREGEIIDIPISRRNLEYLGRTLARIAREGGFA